MKLISLESWFLRIRAEVGDPTKPPVFSSTYITKAIMYIPYAEIEEPLTAFYDEKAGASRIDYYGGKNKLWSLHYRSLHIHNIGNLKLIGRDGENLSNHGE